MDPFVIAVIVASALAVLGLAASWLFATQANFQRDTDWWDASRGNLAWMMGLFVFGVVVNTMALTALVSIVFFTSDLGSAIAVTASVLFIIALVILNDYRGEFIKAYRLFGMNAAMIPVAS